MATKETLNEIAQSFLPEQQVEVSKWFGKPCLKSKNKVFLVLWGENLALKLTGQAHAKALALPGARLFDPRGEGHPMKEWVHVKGDEGSILGELAQQAFAYAVEQG